MPAVQKVEYSGKIFPVSLSSGVLPETTVRSDPLDPLNMDVDGEEVQDGWQVVKRKRISRSTGSNSSRHNVVENSRPLLGKRLKSIMVAPSPGKAAQDNVYLKSGGLEDAAMHLHIQNTNAVLETTNNFSHLPLTDEAVIASPAWASATHVSNSFHAVLHRHGLVC